MTFNQTPLAQLSVMQGLFAEYEAAGKFPVLASDMIAEFFKRLPQPNYNQNQYGRFFYSNLESVAKIFNKEVTFSVGPKGKKSKVTVV